MSADITGKYMVMAPVEAVVPDQRFRHLPPHLTILPWFDLAITDRAYFHDRMSDIVEEEGFSHVAGAGRELFGPSNTKPVTALRGVLLGVHCHAMRVMGELDIEIDEQFTGLNYVPHVSDRREGGVEVDQEIKLTSLAVMTAGPGRIKIVDTVYELRS